MSGTIEEIPLPDLLQLLSSSRKSGVLAIRSKGGFGKIYLRGGQIRRRMPPLPDPARTGSYTPPTRRARQWSCNFVPHKTEPL